MKKESIKNYYNNYEDEKWRKKEQERQRKKYRKLNYKDKQINRDKTKKWKTTSEYRNLSRDLKLRDGLEAHHWSYKKEHLRDVFVLERRHHRQAHRFLTFDKKLKCYLSKEGILLDTREKHKEFLERMNIYEKEN